MFPVRKNMLVSRDAGMFQRAVTRQNCEWLKEKPLKFSVGVGCLTYLSNSQATLNLQEPRVSCWLKHLINIKKEAPQQWCPEAGSPKNTNQQQQQ